MDNHLRWGILATGAIARAFAQGLRHSKTGQLVAVGSRSTDSAMKFGAEFGLPAASCHGTYEALLADPRVEAIYVSNPHPGHAEWTIRCAEAGKHILCEKPLAMNHAEAMTMIEAARRHDVFLMEAFMYRCHPQTGRLVDLIREGTIGPVRMIQGTFGFRAGDNVNSRLLDSGLGGGGILDVGCYPVSMSRLIAGVALGQPFANPVKLTGAGHLGTTGVDDYAAALALFPGDIVAQLSTSVRLNQENILRVFGDGGHLVVPNPWTPARDGGASTIFVHRAGEKTPQEVVVQTVAGAQAYLYTLEADHVAAHIADRQSPAMSWADTLGNMQALDAWRDAIGLSYPLEAADYPTAGRTVAGRPLQRRSGHAMKYGRVDGLDKPVSRLVLGCDNQRTYPHAAAVFDGYVEAGGNCFDTAYGYQGGLPERLLGQWMRNRSEVRDEMVIIAKGAHTPLCNPVDLTSQLHTTLERLDCERVDLYIMHRDNPDIPVGEFVDVLNEHHAAGRIKAFGGSNWTLARVNEANAYAAQNGLRPFTVVSNNFSLARMVDPVWAGCISASDPESRAWFQRERIALFAWSSQARGFFLPTAPAGTNSPTEAEIARCWHSPDNFRRRERALELARARGVESINIALAYVLCQPFPTFPLFGPRTLEEIRTSLPALGIALTPEELAWLDLESDKR